MISGASIDRCVRILLTTFYHMQHYTVQLLGRWSSVHIIILYTQVFAINIIFHATLCLDCLLYSMIIIIIIIIIIILILLIMRKEKFTTIRAWIWLTNFRSYSSRIVTMEVVIKSFTINCSTCIQALRFS